MRDDLDRFYTAPATANKCLQALDITLYDCIIEPSAGAGVFLDALDSLLKNNQGKKDIQLFAIDVSPQSDNVKRFNWFDAGKKCFSGKNHILVLGNPPFGQRSTLAKQFITHSIDVGAETIAFILPNTFSKYTNQRCFPDDWRLIDIVSLTDEECQFLLSSGENQSKTIFIPCSFFIWTKRCDISPSINLRDVIVEQPKQYGFLSRGDNRADFTLNGNNGKTKNLDEVTNSKSEHYIQVSPDYSVDDIRFCFDDIDFAFVSSVNGGVAWISQNDVNKAFLKYWGEHYIE